MNTLGVISQHYKRFENIFGYLKSLQEIILKVDIGELDSYLQA
jgi:hypothetical protein